MNPKNIKKNNQLYFNPKITRPERLLRCKNHENPSLKSHTWAPIKMQSFEIEMVELGIILKGLLLKVPKFEIFHLSDFHDFYNIKSPQVGDFGVKNKIEIYSFLGELCTLCSVRALVPDAYAQCTHEFLKCIMLRMF